MKIISCEVENFASYKHLKFDLEDSGVTLIQGANGSGKSTLCDIVPWILFGVTAKNGKADDILSWHGGEAYGTISIDINGRTIQVTRSRKPNDLYFRNEDNTDANPTRGKDLQDTQRLINQLLGMDAEMYLACAYSHEFSQTAQFFMTNAKTRREITERMVDLSLPIRLQEAIKKENKSDTDVIACISSGISSIATQIHNNQNQYDISRKRNDNWLEDQKKREKELKSCRPKFSEDLGLKEKIESVKKEISEQNTICEHCGSKLDTAKMKELKSSLLTLQSQEIDYKLKLLRSENIEAQLAALKKEKNIHSDDMKKYGDLLASDKIKLKTLEDLIVDAKEKQLQLELLSDAVTILRAELVENTVKDLESRTNRLVYDHFEGSIQVEFSVASNDKLDVQIQKDGNECSYSQLSKGQQKILKLCFGVAVMNIATEHNGLQFSQLFFDEALDGMDDTNKLKAVRLLETLAASNGSVYLVEHSETIKAMIDQKYNVELVDGKSQLSKA